MLVSQKYNELCFTYEILLDSKGYYGQIILGKTDFEDKKTYNSEISTHYLDKRVIGLNACYLMESKLPNT